MKTKIIILIGLLTVVNLAQAQQSYNNEFNLNAGVGISALQYKPIMGEKNSGVGEVIGIGYTHFFSPKWGISTGLDLEFYNAKTTIDNMYLKYKIPTPQGLVDNFYLQATYTGYEEKQNVTFLQLPVMLQMRIPIERNFFYIAGGLKVGFPFSGTYESTIQSLTTTGKSDYTGQLYENMPNHGFDTHTNIQPSGNLDLDIAYLLALETGMKWTLSEKCSLYTGIYLNYGLNDINKQTNQELLAYNSNSPRAYQYNSLLHSQSEGNGFVDKIYPFSVGIKIKLGIGLGSASASISKTKEAKPSKSKYVVEKKSIDETANKKEIQVEKKETSNKTAVAKANEIQALTPMQRNTLERPIEGYNLQDIDLNDKQKMFLVYRITILKSNPALKITIEGHAFDSEDFAENNEIGKGRADKVKEYLIDKGIAAERITTLSKGDTVPADSDKNNSANRRVQIIVD
ncbi:MAG: OmpA family protein [Candidatus Symbiothrix sp.]|jgi:outer membrane protein OmpA-like peptidoglycan-associated protein|nr:OmpA family protein [Candidatus Symbiothrix sp.]